MEPTTTARPDGRTASFTERLARSSATHPWRTMGIWLAIIVVAVLSVSSLLGSGLTSEMKQHGRAARQHDRAAPHRGPHHRPAEDDRVRDRAVRRSHGEGRGLQGLRDRARRRDRRSRRRRRRERGDLLPDEGSDAGLQGRPRDARPGGHGRRPEHGHRQRRRAARGRHRRPRRRLHPAADGRRQPEADGQRARRERHAEDRDLRRAGRARRAGRRLRRPAGRVHAAGAQRRQHHPGAGAHGPASGSSTP